MLNYHLRPAKDEDLKRIAEIWHTSASLPDVGPPTMPSYSDLRLRVDQEIEAGWEVTLAVAGAAVIGFIALKPKESILAEVFLCPDQIGNGVGKMLLDYAKTEMPGGFTLFTTSANVRARHFYEREGLTAFREAPHPRSGHPVTYFKWHGK
jgi:GNAT superfamily N-acetyltransferase